MPSARGLGCQMFALFSSTKACEGEMSRQMFVVWRFGKQLSVEALREGRWWNYSMENFQADKLLCCLNAWHVSRFPGHVL